MWDASMNALQMTEGDFGVKLPITVSGLTLTENDQISVIIKDSMNGDTILEKTFSNIQDNTINFELTSSESELLPVGSYVYRMDWFQSGHFMCNLIPTNAFKVVDKA